jgi:hypothetical protein
MCNVISLLLPFQRSVFPAPRSVLLLLNSVKSTGIIDCSDDIDHKYVWEASKKVVQHGESVEENGSLIKRIYYV